MSTPFLPDWLPDWIGAESTLARKDSSLILADVHRLIDLMFADDGGVLDSLDEEAEAALVPVVEILSRLVEAEGEMLHVFVAARLARRTAEPYLASLPPELRQAFERLPGSGTNT